MGDTLPGLRAVVEGFAPADGYDIRRIEQWSTAQKRRVRDYYNRVHKLEAQERRIVFPRSKSNLRALQDAFHGDIGSRKFKAAFVPYTDPKGLPGAKHKQPRISYLKSGISIDAGPYKRLFVPFNKRALVKDAQTEIERVLESMPGSRLHFIQTGEFQTLNGMSPKILAERVLQYMNQYDGKKPLPRSSGNYGDHPKTHHYKYWLNGVVGYLFPKTIDTKQMHRRIVEGMKEAKKRRADQDKKMNSKRRR